jgi:hypothetical protein
LYLREPRRRPRREGRRTGTCRAAACNRLQQYFDWNTRLWISSKNLLMQSFAIDSVLGNNCDTTNVRPAIAIPL